MIIRSQNKKELHNFDRITMIRIVTNSQEFFLEVNGQHVLGVYSTEEKAMNVLDDMFDAFKNTAFVDVATYQMPQDCEV